MKVTFITPHVGRKSASEYVRTWQMEPLPIATLAGLTPDDVEIAYYDERVERVDFDAPTDLAAITVETYTAKRAYEIAREYHERGIPTVLGGYHVTLVPEEAAQYADSIVVGFAEPLWETVVRDCERGAMKRRYTQDRSVPYEYVMPRRDIFGKRPYFELSCIETGRGCPLRCNFCSIAAATSSTYNARPVSGIVGDIERLKHRNVFFVEDNFVGNLKRNIPTSRLESSRWRLCNRILCLCTRCRLATNTKLHLMCETATFRNSRSMSRQEMEYLCEWLY